ncbi:MAG TPA: TolC family protein, partial [Verrucomicrobiae bacterium]|nr:TolC family protein [Verrucomicrobiae bacterium]
MKSSVEAFWSNWSGALLLVLCAGATAMARAETPAQTNAPAAIATNLPAWLTRPISMLDALNIAFQQNGTILKARSDLEANYGVAIQTRAILIPKIQASGAFNSSDRGLIDTIPGVPATFPHENWNSGIQIVQSIYEGGRMVSAFRSARLTREQAVAQYKTVVADTLLATRVAYADVLVAAQQILVNEASVTLLSRELEDQQRRFEAGTVPRFNVLRAEVAVANERPALIRARNAFRIAKNNLVNLLGYDLPRNVWQDIPLQLTDTLEAIPYEVELPLALAQALENRTELAALRKAEQLQKENVVVAKSGYKPSLQAFAGYDWRSSQFDTDLGHELHGWTIGGQVNWNIFDGFLTHGKVVQATALYERARTDVADTSRRVELEVRTAYSSFLEAREVLESQQKVQEEADEALRLARARAEAGTGTQLDVLNAETALTQARTTQI